MTRVCRVLGLDPKRGARSIASLPTYFRQLRELKTQLAQSRSDFALVELRPVLDERDAPSGVATGHYFHQDMHVARCVFKAAPERHLDVGSRVDGFVAHVATFRAIEVVDLRALRTSEPNIRFLQADLMDPASVGRLGTADSVSCLHALEHFGLGRYGDPLDADGHLKGLSNLCRLVAPGGSLYLSVPIGPQRIEFNAHRVFSARTIPEAMPGDFVLKEFSYVDDAGDLHVDVDFSGPDLEISFGCKYGCGIYEFVRGIGADKTVIDEEL